MESLNTFTFPPSINSISDFMEKTDDDGILQIYSYKYCNNDSDELVKKSRGLVFNGETQLFKSLGFTPEYNETNFSYLSTLSLEDYKFYKSEEGTLIRVFFHDKWYVSTHRKLDAFNSRWSSKKTFGDIFKDSLKKCCEEYDPMEKLTSSLDKEKVYFFLIRNTDENRIVCKAPSENSPSFYYVGNIGFGDNGLYSTDLPNGICSIPLQEELKFSSWDKVFEYVKNVNPYDSQGLIAFDKVGNQFKIINDKYQLYSQVRGNESNLVIRYLQIRGNPSLSSKLLELYPEQASLLLNYEFIINMIAKEIHTAYISRFVQKKHVVVSKNAYKIVKECHGWHISNRQSNKVTFNQVMNVLSQEKFLSTLYYLVKNYKEEGHI